MRLLSLILFALFFSSCVGFESEYSSVEDCPEVTHTKSGTLQDYLTSEPLEGVEVFLNEIYYADPGRYSSFTDDLGNFEVSGEITNCSSTNDGYSYLEISFPDGYDASTSKDGITYLYQRRNVRFEFLKTDTSSVSKIFYDIESETRDFKPNTFANPIQTPIHVDNIKLAVDTYITLNFRTDMDSTIQEVFLLERGNGDFVYRKYY